MFRSLIFLSFCLAILSSGVFAAENQKTNCGLWDTALAGSPEFKVGEHVFLFKAMDGTGIHTVRGGNAKVFDFKLPKSMCLEYVTPYIFDNQLFMVVKYGDGEVGGSFLLKLSPDSAATIWKASLEGFNPSKPYWDGKSIFIASMEILARIDPKNGKMIWKISDVYKKYHLHTADSIIEKDDNIIFQEGNRKVEVNKESGIIQTHN